MEYEQVWFCRACHTIGDTFFAEDESSKSVIKKIMASHEYLAPHCPTSILFVEVINHDCFHSKHELMECLPPWAIEDIAQLLNL